MELHLYFGKKDVDLILWKSTLPRGAFSKLLQIFFEAEINGSKANIPEINYKEPDKDIKPYHIVLHVKNKVIEQYLNMIPSYQRNAVIKSVIRKNIQDLNKYELFVPVQKEIVASNKAVSETKQNKNKSGSQNNKKKKTQFKPIDIPISKPKSEDLSQSSAVNGTNNDTISSVVSEENTNNAVKSALLRMAGD